MPHNWVVYVVQSLLVPSWNLLGIQWLSFSALIHLSLMVDSQQITPQRRQQVREKNFYLVIFLFCFGGLISLVNLCPFGSVWWDTHWTWKLHLTWLWHWKLQQQPELWMADPEPASYEFLHCGYYRRAPSRASPNLWLGLLGVQTG